jgi:hypothetical protein
MLNINENSVPEPAYAGQAGAAEGRKKYEVRNVSGLLLVVPNRPHPNNNVRNSPLHFIKRPLKGDKTGLKAALI